KIGTALVVGAGIGGIRSALDLAETGYRVILIDRRPGIGGILSQLEQQFPSNGCGMCRLLPTVERDQAAQFCLRKGLFHERIEILTGTEVAAVSGDPGRFTVTLKEQPRWIDPKRCVGCGLCVAACPVTVADPFNAGFTERRAIYLPVPQAVPTAYTIDLGACTRCGSCEAVCPVGAIQLDRDGPGHFNVLVVDDEEILRGSLKAWLEEAGYRAVTAASGAEALERLSSERFHLMLTDIKMPGLGGVELLELALTQQPELVVVMMTAYATVDTAVDAMKFGALDYLTKPFEPQDILQMVARVYGDHQAERARQIEVGTIVMNCGTAFHDPGDERNLFQYGHNPHVLTSLEFERLLSGLGPHAGRLRRPADGRRVTRVAWIQCVGSRNLSGVAAEAADSDFCSSVCCMMALKEALLAVAHADAPLSATIFYMDMRAYGKGFERYRQRAAATPAIQLVRGRVHSLEEDPGGEPRLRWVTFDGRAHEDHFDLVVLPVGQRPAPGTAELTEILGLSCNRWGFPHGQPLDPTLTERPGIFIGGSWGGLQEIAGTVISASAAAAHAALTLHRHGGSLAEEKEPPVMRETLFAEVPRILVILCRCDAVAADATDAEAMLGRTVERFSGVCAVQWIERLCTADGWRQIGSMVADMSANRILLGVCNPYLFTDSLKRLARSCGLCGSLCETVSLGDEMASGASRALPVEQVVRRLRRGAARLFHAEPQRASADGCPVERRALVIGGGVAGLTGALTIAEMGYPVTLVERSDRLGGNLAWLHSTLSETATTPLLEDLSTSVAHHPAIDLLLAGEVTAASGQAGDFTTTLRTADGEVQVRHGIVLLATGGMEAEPVGYLHGAHPGVVTQKELTLSLEEDPDLPDRLDTVVFIQCVGSRDATRPYCSRVCCPTTLKQVLALKRANPSMQITVFYRDMMSPGFTETYFTDARRTGVIFVPYARAAPPVVDAEDGEGALRVRAVDPILNMPIEIAATRVVLATGIVPQLPAQLAEAYGADCAADGFFAEADSKWRPLESLADGVFACGLALGPQDVPGSVVSARAAAQRGLRFLARNRLPTATVSATVRRALCTLCERCIAACPYGARQLSVTADAIQIHPALCQGCGSCAAACPNGAAQLTGYSRRQMLAEIDAVLE
ncbi:MAG: FAD-dependent oxidoreductase, partial [Desulfosarcinaceae bacterium]|nr:FAD-dependent oxidoreductase [Desulfosarcinaceae bacterium]